MEKLLNTQPSSAEVKLKIPSTCNANGNYSIVSNRLSCHNKKSTDVSNKINYSSILNRCAFEPYQ